MTPTIMTPEDEMVLAIACALDPASFGPGSDQQFGHVPAAQQHAKKRARRLIKIMRYWS